MIIIAEAGVNHNGDTNLALQLVEAAARAGADIVKFQTFHTDLLISKAADKAGYQKRNTGTKETQFEMLKRLELPPEAWEMILSKCKRCGIEFMSTPFDTASIDFLARLGVCRWKIPSGEITNLPFLQKIGGRGEGIILSTGMADLGEVEDAIETLEAAGTPRSLITVLHCTTEYPAPIDEVNLRAMLSMKAAFGVRVGYSDHTEGIAVPLAAAALGAEVIEKHFTLDRALPGPDHVASLEPAELAQMIVGIHQITRAMGDGVKRIMPSEAQNRAIARKCIVAARTIQEGEIFEPGCLTIKRAGRGISPMLWDTVVGRIAPRGFKIDEAIEW